MLSNFIFNKIFDAVDNALQEMDIVEVSIACWSKETPLLFTIFFIAYRSSKITMTIDVI